MREILFRGKTVYEMPKPFTEWIYGYLVFVYTDNPFKARIYNPDTAKSYDVLTETVGQFTGLLDKNGTKIFEGDILRVVDGMGDTLPYTVFWSQENCAFDWRDSTGTDYFYQAIAKNSIIIGNIHENKLEDFNGTGN